MPARLRWQPGARRSPALSTHNYRSENFVTTARRPPPPPPLRGKMGRARGPAAGRAGGADCGSLTSTTVRHGHRRRTLTRSLANRARICIEMALCRRRRRHAGSATLAHVDRRRRAGCKSANQRNNVLTTRSSAAVKLRK